MVRGCKHTQETKDKIRLSLLGKKRATHTEETKAKIRAFMKGRKFSQKHIDGIIAGAKNRKRPPPMSQETRNKIAKSQKGRKASIETILKIREKNLGRKCSLATKQKMRDKARNHAVTEETKRKISKYQRGRKKSKEHSEKIKLANTGKKRTVEFCLLISKLKRGVPQTEAAKISVAKAKEKRWKDYKKRTIPEQKTKELLEKYNIRLKEQKRVRYKLYDFYLPDFNLILEIDGIYWHGKGILKKDLKGSRTPNRKNDIYKNNLALSKGYRLLRIWEDELDKLENLIKNNFIGLEYIEINESNKDIYFEKLINL